METIYLDHNATSPLLDPVAQALQQAYQQRYANPASQHSAGRQARRRLEEARTQSAALLGASTAGMQADRLLFTSGGTEANNHALRGAVGEALEGGHLIISAIEHPSVTETAKWLEKQGAKIDWLPADQHGVVQVEKLRPLLKPTTRLVSVMLGNNETGALQPVRQVVELCAQHGIAVHTDATQVVGKLPIGFQELGVAMLSFSAHKFHGPRGIGGLLVRGGYAPAPLLLGQSQAERPGTPPIELAIGMQRALELWQEDQVERPIRLRAMRDQFEQAILAGDPQTHALGAGAQRLPHTSCLAFSGLDRQALQIAFDRQGVACSTGSACASGSAEPSPALLAMKLPKDQIQGALRFSLGVTTTPAQAAEAARRILLVCKRLRLRKEP